MMYNHSITGFFDSPWTNLFTELYFAMCPRGVRVILSTRDSYSWAISRQANHRRLEASSSSAPAHGRRLSHIGYICPFAPDPRLLDPFSMPQCAAFARRHQHKNHSEHASTRLPGNAAMDFDDAPVHELAAAMEKYNQFVLNLVPDDLLLRINYFTSSLLENRMHSGRSARDAWSEGQHNLVALFTRDT